MELDSLAPGIGESFACLAPVGQGATSASDTDVSKSTGRVKPGTLAAVAAKGSQHLTMLRQSHARASHSSEKRLGQAISRQLLHRCNKQSG